MFVPTSTTASPTAPPSPPPTTGPGGGHPPTLNWDPYLLNVVFPVLGVILANIMAASPLPEFYRIFQSQKLHPIDPFPIVIMFACATHTFTYGVAVQNPYLYLSNAPAVLIQGFCMIALFRARDFPPEKVKTAVGVILGSIGLLLANIGLFYVVKVPWGQQLLGVTFNVYQYAFFLFPLIQLLTVFYERNAGILVPHLVIAVTVNGVIWSIFGLTLQDWFVAGPNIAASIVGAVQIICIIVFGRSTKKSGASGKNRRNRGNKRRRRGDGYQPVNTEEGAQQQGDSDDDEEDEEGGRNAAAGSSSRAN